MKLADLLTRPRRPASRPVCRPESEFTRRDWADLPVHHPRES